MDIVKKCIIYALCLFYSAKVLFGIVILFFTKSHLRFWVVKKRPIPPKCLQDPEFGEHKYIHVNGIKLHYVEKGDQSKPLMVLVHGFPEFWYSWRYQLKEFSKDYWTVAIDMRGYGGSDKPEGVESYQIDHLTEDIKQLVLALERKKFTLIAHDWGAVVGWHFVYKHMDMIEKYVMLDAPPSPVFQKLVSSSMTQFKMSWYIFFYQMPKLPEFALRMFDLKFLDVMKSKSGKTTNEDLEAYKYTFTQKDAFTCPINYYRANFNSTKRKLTKPTDFAPGLYLIGEHDLYISKETGPMAKQFYENLDYQVVKGANHFAQQDAPEEVNAMIRSFLKK